MTENEKSLFMAVGSLGIVVAGLLQNQAETNRVLADKLPDISPEAIAALNAAADQTEQESAKYAASAKNLLDIAQRG